MIPNIWKLFVLTQIISFVTFTELSGIPAKGMERLNCQRLHSISDGGNVKVQFRPRQFIANGRAGNIICKGSFHGIGIDFLEVMSRLYELPFLWFSEGILMELDFESQNLILKAPEDKGEDFHAREVIKEIPLKDLVLLPTEILRDKHIRPFAADLAEYNFGMPKTAKAIRERKRHSLMSEIATEEGHPVLDTEIENLLFRKDWNIKSSYRSL